MTGLRTYGDPCGIARALDVVGERWALLIVRELLLGPKRFTDLRAALGASPNVLTQRLADLESTGVVWIEHTGKPEWGRGKLLREFDGKLEIEFPTGGTRTLKADLPALRRIRD